MKNDLKTKPTEKLQAELKGIRLATGIFAGVLGFLFLLTIYNAITIQTKSDYVMVILPFALSPLLFTQFSTMKKIKAELRLRGDIT